MWFLRRMLRISWTERKSIREVMEKANYKRGLLSKIRRRQAKFMGHIMRREGMGNLVTTGKIDGKRAPGRQRTKMMDDLLEWLVIGRNSNTIKGMHERDEWRAMIVSASLQGT